MPAGSNLGQVQAFNRRVVLELIRIHGPISRAEIARRTNLTRQTVSNIVTDLAEAHMVQVTGKQRFEGGGKPSASLEINPAAAYSIGINLYLDEMTALLIDFAGNIRQRVHRRMEFAAPPDAVPVVREVSQGLLRAEGIGDEELWGAGIGLPGPLSTVSEPEPTSLSAWREAAVVEEFSELLGVPVFFENNANVGAIGERWYGAGRQLTNYVYISFGLFLGGGLVLNGQLFGGSGGFAAELGDVPTTATDDRGGILSLSEIASPATALRLLEAAGEAELRVEDLAALLEMGHPLLVDWLDRVALHLAPILTTLEYALDPQAFIFGGRLPEALLAYLVQGIEATTPALRTQNKPYRPELLVSRAGEDGAALGAATLPLYQTLDPNPSVLFIAPNAIAKGAGTSLREQLLKA